MNEQFVKDIIKSIVEENIKIYKDLYDSYKITDKNADYWKDSIQLYQSFDENQKEIFYRILEQTMIDTISNLFGVLDGNTNLYGKEYEISVEINGVDTNNELQDSFLEYIEENVNDIFR